MTGRVNRSLSLAALLTFLTGCSSGPLLRPSFPPTLDFVERPLRFVYGLPVLDVDINGVAVPLFLDLGGFDTVALETRQLEKLAVAFTGESTTYTDISGTRYTSRGYVIPEMRIGDIVLTDVAGSEHLHPSGDPESTRMGYLGRAVLERFRLIVDFPREKVVLINKAPPKDYPVADWHACRFRNTRDGITLDIFLDGTKRTVILDTAAGGSRLRPSAAQGYPSTLRDGRPTVRIAELRLGDRNLGPHEFAVGEVRIPGVDGLLGSPFFRGHAVHIDFVTGLLAIR